MHKFIANQLKQPSGRFGSLITARFLNRANGPINNLVFHHLNPQPADKVLEIGFGGGELMAQIITKRGPEVVAGVDFSREMVAFCLHRFRQHPNIRLSCGSAEALPYPNNYFSKIGTVNTIYFWDDLRPVIQECARVLQPEGQLTIGFTSKLSLQRSHRVTQHGFHYYETTDVEGAMKAVGFKNIKMFSASARGDEFFCARGVI